MMKRISYSISIFAISSLATLQSRVCGFSPSLHPTPTISPPSSSRSRSRSRSAHFAHTSINDEESSSYSPIVDRSSFLKKAASAAIVSIAATITTTTAAQQATAAELPKLGTKAPDFTLPKTRSSSTNAFTSIDELSQSGKWTVLYFYPGAFTSGCTLEARGFQKDIENYRALNAQIVGVSVDAIEKNNQFCEEEQLDFMLLSDMGGKVSKAYGSALSIPGFGTFSNRQTYLIDPNGYVQFVFTDVESKVARHSAEVLDKLKELQG